MSHPMADDADLGNYHVLLRSRGSGPELTLRLAPALDPMFFFEIKNNGKELLSSIKPSISLLKMDILRPDPCHNLPALNYSTRF